MIIRWGYNNRLKVAGIRQLLSKKNRNTQKQVEKKRIVFLHLLYIRDLLDCPFFLFHRRYDTIHSEYAN